MYGYKCIVTTKKKKIVLCSLRVEPDWIFDIMTMSLPIKLHWSLPLCPEKCENRCSGEQLTRSTFNNTNCPSFRTIFFFSNHLVFTIHSKVLVGNSAVSENFPFNRSTVAMVYCVLCSYRQRYSSSEWSK